MNTLLNIGTFVGALMLLVLVTATLAASLFDT
jgi:hypothetical protein